jgi:hypothetical protein
MRFSAVLQRPQNRAVGPLTCPQATHSIPRAVPHPSQYSLVVLFWRPQLKHSINGPSDVSGMDCIQRSSYRDRTINSMPHGSNKNNFLRASGRTAYRDGCISNFWSQVGLVKCSVGGGAIVHQTRCGRSGPRWRGLREPGTMAAANKCLARSNKSPTGSNATNKPPAASQFLWASASLARPVAGSALPVFHRQGGVHN